MLLLFAMIACQGDAGSALRTATFSRMRLRLDGVEDGRPCVEFLAQWGGGLDATTAAALAVSIDGAPMAISYLGDDGDFAQWRVFRESLPPRPGVHIVTLTLGNETVEFVAAVPASAWHLLPSEPLGSLAPGAQVRIAYERGTVAPGEYMLQVHAPRTLDAGCPAPSCEVLVSARLRRRVSVE